MKKKVLSALILAMIVVLTSCSKNEPSESDEINSEVVISQIESESEEVSESSVESEKGPSETSSESVSEESESEETSGYDTLILVNPTHYIPDDYTVNLITVQGKYKLDEKAAEHAIELLADAKEAGFDMKLCSAYRTVEKSAELYQKKVLSFIKLGYSEADAKVEAAKWVAPPGTSEHHTGLAMDLVSSDYWEYYSDLEHEYENFDSFKWLYEHCWEYGFVLRYPKDKQEITGITYEPWHYRYVGVEAAKYIMENGLCLEEYLNAVDG